MLGVIDYIVVAGIQKKLNFLSHNPRHIDFILSGLYCNPDVRRLIGDDYLKEAIDYIKNNKIHVAPAFALDHQKMPCIVVNSSGTEGQQYIGDYGAFSTEVVQGPNVYYRFDATSISGFTIQTTSLYKLDEKLEHNATVGNGTFISNLDSVYNSPDGKTTNINLKDPIPEGASLKDWMVLSDDKLKRIVYSASTDDIEVSLILRSSGAYSQHLLFSTVLRYCLKSLRIYFDAAGLQVSSSSYGFANLADPEDMIFESHYSLGAKFTETWIDQEYDLPNKIDLCIIAESIRAGTEPVLLSDFTNVIPE